MLENRETAQSSAFSQAQGTQEREEINQNRIVSHLNCGDLQGLGGDMEANSVQILLPEDIPSMRALSSPDMCGTPTPSSPVQQASQQNHEQKNSLDLPVRLSLNYSVELLRIVKHLTDGNTVVVKLWAKSIKTTPHFVKRLIIKMEIAGFPIWEPGPGKFKLLRKQDL